MAISSLDGGQFVSHVLQWNTRAPDFSSTSNPSRSNVTVWLWSFGHTISNSMRSLISLLLLAKPSDLVRCPLDVPPEQLVKNSAARPIRYACPIGLSFLIVARAQHPDGRFAAIRELCGWRYVARLTASKMPGECPRLCRRAVASVGVRFVRGSFSRNPPSSSLAAHEARG